MSQWRLLDHGAGPPEWNMAMDRILLDFHATAGGPPTLRFYQWDRPTLSLGAGQRASELPRGWSGGEGKVAVVRRPTGGRAVLHGGDLTYSLVAGRREGFPASVTGVYRRVRRGLQRGLVKLGLEAEAGAPGRPGPAFLCFARAASGDLTWKGRKFLGSAQVWQGESFLQHGSLLFSRQGQGDSGLLEFYPDGRPEVAWLAEILPRGLTLADLKAALRDGLQEELGMVLIPATLSPWEQGELARRGWRSGAPAGAVPSLPL